MKNNLLKSCLCASLFLGSFCLNTPANADEYLLFPESNPFIEYHIMPMGSVFGNEKVSRQFTDNEKFVLSDVTKRWQETLNLNPKNPAKIDIYATDVKNAFANSDYVTTKEERITHLAASLLGLKIHDDETEAKTRIIIGSGLANEGGWLTYTEPYALFQGDLPDLYSIITHELYHALGLSTNAGGYQDAGGNITYLFSGYNDLGEPDPLNVYDKNLRVTDRTNIIESAPGMEIKVNSTGSFDASGDIFDVADGSPYFVGLDTMMALSNLTIEDLEQELGIDKDNENFEEQAINYMETFIKKAGGLKNYSNQYSNDATETEIVFGLPINGLEEEKPGQFTPELSHIELRNSFMSHQAYRNWGILMEAELGLLKDIGYDEIEPREFFGKSYYLNNITDTWTGHKNDGIGYGYWDVENQQYTNAPSEMLNGVGLHLYGDNLNITQNASIASKGFATIGVRIDGVGNTYTLGEDFTIKTTGKNNIGIATTWGKNHTLNLEQGSVVDASGENGIGLSFDFGKNILGTAIGHRGSYSSNTQNVPDDINGALVSDVNIAGKIIGSTAAIYISESAHVENINIMDGSEINGNIISKWNSKTNNNTNIKANETKYTNINFGSDGLGGADSNYNGNYTGVISGANEKQNTLKLNIQGGELTYNDGKAIVNSVDIAQNATLTGSASYKVDNDFVIGTDANYNPTGNSLINAKSIINNGFINVKENFVLASPLISDIDGDVNIYGTMYVLNDTHLSSDGSNNLVFYNGSTLNLINNAANNITLGTMALDGNANLYVDANIVTREVDRLVFEDKDWLDIGDNHVNIAGVNLIHPKEVIKEKQYDFLFVDESFNNQNLLGKVTMSDKRTIDTPIYKYNLSYNEANQRGNISLNRMNTGTYRDFNPAVFASSVAAQVGGYLNQLNTFNEAFSSMDSMMSLPSNVRQSMNLRNKYASNGNIQTFNPNQMPEEQRGLWFKPFTTFEKVDLNNGPSVNNTAYGSFIGGDSQRYELKHGWNAVYTGYAGYLGSHQRYNGVNVYQNGGVLGATGLFYKKNFFTGITANVGASGAEANNMYGKEDIAMLNTGVAAKTGYNWEFAKGKFIIQPNALLSYSFINTFDYTNSAGLRVKSSPLNAIQIAPGVKFIGNLPNNWQPYASVQMLWNIMDKTKFSIADVNLPELSVDPYVQYGVGLQKTMGDRFTGFGQVMLRNGGRTGVSLSAGFRWALGK